MDDFSPLVLLIIAANLIFSFLGFRNRNLFERYAFHTGAVLHKRQWDRLFTSAFLHVDVMHLLFNMISFYSFGINIEQSLGFFILLVIYFGGMLAGDLLALYIQRNQPDYQAVGASGAVSAVIFASILFFPEGSIYIIPIPIPIPSFLFGFLFIAVSVWGIGRADRRIGHEAHLGGAAWGVAAAVFVHPMALIMHPIVAVFLIAPLAVFAWILIYRPELLKPR